MSRKFWSTATLALGLGFNVAAEPVNLIFAGDIMLDDGPGRFIGEGGDDIMVGSPGRGKMAGMSGFDWATYFDSATAVNAAL